MDAEASIIEGERLLYYKQEEEEENLKVRHNVFVFEDEMFLLYQFKRILRPLPYFITYQF